ncbi:hypothetical protein ACFLRF_00035 [Candidatus Altiarchaeota archaeon]
MADKSDTITFNKKILRGVAPAIAIIMILVSRHQPGPLLLFLVGISCGMLIGWNLREQKKE